MQRSHRRRLRGLLALLAFTAATGCQREWYRQQADDEVACLINEKSYGKWDIGYAGVDPDPHSRYFDPYDPVRPPRPEDDPYSHQFMESVDGMSAWAHWDDFGVRPELQNPDWRIQLAKYVPVEDDGTIQLSLKDAVRLAIMHSPDYRQQIEEVYLSAIDVSTERFRFVTQFYGGVTPGFDLNGTHYKTTPGSGSIKSGADTANLSITSKGTGPSGMNRVLTRQFAAGGQLAIDAINTLTFGYAGGDTYAGVSSLGFTFMQPLLRAGGRQIALEQLTIAERALLANLRAMQQYRQGFYTNIAIGDDGNIPTPNRRGGFQGSSGLSGFSGLGAGGFGGVGAATGFGGGFGGGGNGAGGGAASGTGFAGGGAGTVGGFVGLLQNRQQIRNTEASLRSQQQTVELLEAFLDAGQIEIAQVDQFRQNIETEKANLLQAQAGFNTSVQNFTRGTLGLPPDLKVALDESMIEQFRFQSESVIQLQNARLAIVNDFGNLPQDPSTEQLSTILTRLATLSVQIAEQLTSVRTQDVDGLEHVREQRFEAMSPAEQQSFDADRERLRTTLDRVEKTHDLVAGTIVELQNSLSEETRKAVTREIIAINVQLADLISELTLVQTRARTEAITLDHITLEPEQALTIASANRLDWMNNRAALVDAWRLIEFNGNRLQSGLDVSIKGDMGNINDNNIAGLRAENGSLSASVAFDAPFTRRVERNNYRSQLITYQRQRRAMIRYVDGVNLRLRSSLRNLNQLAVNLEIQRRAVVIAIRRVDQTREDLNKPTPPAQAGAAPAQLGPNAATRLLTALSDLRNTQNNFMSVWLNYYAGRMALMRDLGIMRLDENGMWIDESIEEALSAASGELELPPEIPSEWLDTLERDDVAPGPPQTLPTDQNALPAVPQPPQAAPLLPPPPPAAAGTPTKPRTHLFGLSKPARTQAQLASIDLPEPLGADAVSDPPNAPAQQELASLVASQQPETPKVPGLAAASRTPHGINRHGPAATPGQESEVAPDVTDVSRPGPRRLPHVTTVPKAAPVWRASPVTQ
ncbi:hypothetical protein GC176_03875 [bacterium]|nr:hypothetical protein [bacterium]